MVELKETANTSDMQGGDFSKKVMASLHENTAIFWPVFHKPLAFPLPTCLPGG